MQIKGRFHIFTLGCKINQYESQALREAWIRAGWLEASGPGEAEAILINTCAVTERAVQDVRKAARRLHRENPSARIVITGCAAQRFPRELAQLEGVGSVVPQSRKTELVTGPPDPGLTGGSEELSPAPPGRKYPDLAITDFPRARPVLKVQDGCSQACTYCIVPLTRGPARSREPEEVLQEADRLARAGFRELVLSGINLGQYGRGLERCMDFWDLLGELDGYLAHRHGRRTRLRLSSLDPGLLTEKGLRALAGSSLVCPHLHLSLQSASPSVLRAMGRSHYHPEGIEEFLRRLRRIWPVFGLGADILVGFPGETQEDFLETERFCRRQPLTYGHVFTYSARPGTNAAIMKPRVPGRLKKERSRILRGLLAGKRAAFMRELTGLPEVTVVLEQAEPPLGLCEYYVLCHLEGGRSEARAVEARPLSAGESGLVCGHLREAVRA
jgi:MiaB/RimO family radical SAM methylthiotransferase